VDGSNPNAVRRRTQNFRQRGLQGLDSRFTLTKRGHRLVFSNGIVFLAVMARPLSRAWVTTDITLLGELATQTRSGGLFAGGKRDTTDRYLAVLHKHGLLLDEPNPLLTHRLSAAVTGSFVLAPLTPEFDVEAQADALALTVRRAFEPAEPPDPSAAAEEITGLYSDWLSELLGQLP